jgi:hypothetical protein
MKFWVNGEGRLLFEGEWPSDAIGATKESLHAWQTRLDVLKQGKHVETGGAEECALCYRFYSETACYHCSNCPLYHMQGKRRCGGETLWGEWHVACAKKEIESQKDAAEKMISILEKTLVHLILESDDAPKVEKVEPPPPPKPEPLKLGGVWKDGNPHSPTEFYIALDQLGDKSVRLSAFDYMGHSIEHNFILCLVPSEGVSVCSSINKDVLAAFGGGDERGRLTIIGH